MTTAILLIALAAELIGLPRVNAAVIPAAAPVVAEPTGHRREVPQARAAKPSGPSLRGRASWHATGRDGLYAAAGPALRRWLGPGWRGSLVVVVRGDGRRVTVRLNDYCPCTHRPIKAIDLSDEAMARLGGLSAGVLRVRIYRARHY